MWAYAKINKFLNADLLSIVITSVQKKSGLKEKFEVVRGSQWDKQW